MFLKVADLAALAEQYKKAIEKYEIVARSSAGNNLMKWSMKDYFLKAGICHMATGVSLKPRIHTKNPFSYLELMIYGVLGQNRRKKGIR